MPPEVYMKTFTYARSIDKDAVPNTFIFARYAKKYGNPQLFPHIDNSNTDFTIDYQLDSNIEWPIIIENDNYILKNNDALIFNSSNDTHWRKPIIFNDYNYIDMVFFHFINKDKPNDFKQRATIKGDYIFNYKKEFDKLQ